MEMAIRNACGRGQLVQFLYHPGPIVVFPCHLLADKQPCTNFSEVTLADEDAYIQYFVDVNFADDVSVFGGLGIEFGISQTQREAA